MPALTDGILWPPTRPPLDRDGQGESAVRQLTDGIRGSLGRLMARASFELRINIALCGAPHSFCARLSHGWLAVGHMLSPLPWLRCCPAQLSYCAVPILI